MFIFSLRVILINYIRYGRLDTGIRFRRMGKWSIAPHILHESESSAPRPGNFIPEEKIPPLDKWLGEPQSQQIWMP
jgi:hypothetical protein